MRRLVTLVVLAAWAGLLLAAWNAVRDEPILPAREAPPALSGDGRLYLDRPYGLREIPPALREARVVRTFRHGRHPVHLRLTAEGAIVLLGGEGEAPDAWADFEPMAVPVFVDGAAVDLVRAWRREVGAGDVVVSPLGPGRTASPVLVIGGGDVRRLETPAGLLRRVELATRGFPRRTIAVVLGVLALLGLILATEVAERLSRLRRRARPPA